jgi:ABC-type multidrug transport system fused ATPase/permease subunit
MPKCRFGKAPSPARRVFCVLRHRLPAVALLLGLILVTSGLDIAAPFFTQRLIDGIAWSLSGTRQFAQWILFTSLAGIFVSVAASRLLRSVYNYRLYKTAASLEDEIKSTAFENYLNWDMITLSRSNSGQIIGSLDRGGTAIFVTLYEVLGQNLIPPLNRIYRCPRFASTEELAYRSNRILAASDVAPDRREFPGRHA